MKLRGFIGSWLAGVCIVILYLSSSGKGQQVPATPNPAPGAAAQGGGRRGPGLGPDGLQIQTPNQADLIAMMDALPDKAPVRPKQARKVLVLCKASGFVHGSIPLAAATVKALGEKTDSWTTTITYDSADINESNLKQYDLVFLDSTTGALLDDQNDAAATDARKKALLEFVRSGKGLAGVHAATDSYHTTGRGATPTGTWPDFNNTIGGYFKFHWVYPQVITVKIDDPKSPLTKMFHGKEYVIHDETYTFAQDSFSRRKAHVLTSIDYSKMSDEDKAKEPAATKRTDGDYGLSWIRREGQGRVFYEAHGHSEHVYAMQVIVEHLLAGIQYALGDLPADDSPSVK